MAAWDCRLILGAADLGVGLSDGLEFLEMGTPGLNALLPELGFELDEFFHSLLAQVEFLGNRGELLLELGVDLKAVRCDEIGVFGVTLRSAVVGVGLGLVGLVLALGRRISAQVCSRSVFNLLRRVASPEISPRRGLCSIG
jgi:hypothetical protein